MVWLYLLAAVFIAWGIARDLSRQDTWLIGFGRIGRQDRPRHYWLTIGLRVLILLAVIIAAWFRGQAP